MVLFIRPTVRMTYCGKQSGERRLGGRGGDFCGVREAAGADARKGEGAAAPTGGRGWALSRRAAVRLRFGHRPPAEPLRRHSVGPAAGNRPPLRSPGRYPRRFVRRICPIRIYSIYLSQPNRGATADRASVRRTLSVFHRIISLYL